MVDTIRSRAAIVSLFADNSTGDISAQDLRDCLISINALRLQTDKGTVSSGTTTLGADIAKQKITAGGDFTIAFDTWPASGDYAEVEIELVNGGAHTITWPTVNWLAGDGTYSTTFSSMGVTLQTTGTNWIVIWSTDGGTTLWGRAS